MLRWLLFLTLAAFRCTAQPVVVLGVWIAASRFPCFTGIATLSAFMSHPQELPEFGMKFLETPEND